VLSNRVLNEFYFMRATASDRNYQNKDYTPANVLNNVVTMPASLGAGQYIGTPQYRFPSLIWGNNQCLWPCRTGTMTTFTEAQETLTISAGSHNWKMGGSIQFFPTHEWAASNPGTWTFGRDQFFDPLNPSFNFNSLAPTQFTAAFPNVFRDISATTRRKSRTSGSAVGVTFNLGLGTTSRPASGMSTTHRPNIRARCRMSISRRAATRTTSVRAPASHGTSATTDAPWSAADTASCIRTSRTPRRAPRLRR
jgi:hypothetical protein